MLKKPGHFYELGVMEGDSHVDRAARFANARRVPHAQDAQTVLSAQKNILATQKDHLSTIGAHAKAVLSSQKIILATQKNIFAR